MEAKGAVIAVPRDDSQGVRLTTNNDLREITRAFAIDNTFGRRSVMAWLNARALRARA